MNCTKAIIPVAGFGTRRLPVTKAVEKCMLPVLNRPVIDYIVQDCIAAGVRDFYFVVGEECVQLRNYYQRNEALEAHLKQHGKDAMLDMIMPPEGVGFHFIVQSQAADAPYGTSVPVWLARDVIEDGEKVLVIMGDQFMFNEDGASETKRFFELAEKAGTPSAMLTVEVPHEDVNMYGIVATRERDGVEIFEEIVEKPSVEDAPSNLNNASFYLFDQAFFDFLDQDIAMHHDGEYMITDPLNEYVQAGNEIVVIRNKGEYLDCGTVDGWLYANERVRKAQG